MRMPYYTVIPANVMHDNRLKLLSRLLYGDIAGTLNEKGYCNILNDSFAELYKTSTSTITGCLKELKDYGYITTEAHYKEAGKEIEKRIIRLRSPFSENDIPIKKTETKDDNDEIYNTCFEKFWEKYPIKKAKAGARLKYINILKHNEAKPEEILAGLDKYLVEIEYKGTERKYIKHPKTWLNNRCWQDEYETKPQEIKEEISLEEFRRRRRKEIEEWNNR